MASTTRAGFHITIKRGNPRGLPKAFGLPAHSLALRPAHSRPDGRRARSVGLRSPQFAGGSTLSFHKVSQDAL